MKANYIIEIQGLRTLAALLVAVYHIWFQKVSGGVDVFFVISAYFIAYSLSKHNSISILELVGYYSKTIRRILPSAFVVFLFSAVLMFAFVPYVYFNSEMKNSIATIFFIENWYLSISGSSYLSDEGFKSIFQQYWALSVQVQFYILFPAILLVLSNFFGSQNLSKKINLFFIPVAIASFLYALFITNLNPSWAYFDAFARAWEFIFGLLLFNNIDKLKLNKITATFLNVSAITAIILFGFFVPQTQPMPGLITLIPVCSACIIIISSRSDLLISPLATKLLAKFGDYSFSFYLWHWPIFIIVFNYNSITGNAHLDGLLVLLVSAIFAWITTKFVESPIRKSRFLSINFLRTAVFLCLVLFFESLISGFFVKHYYDIKRGELAKLESFYLSREFQSSERTVFFPHPLIIKQDLPETYTSGCHQRKLETDAITCSFGDESSSNLVVLVGGSHSTQWLPPLKLIAEQKGFHLISITKSDCSFTGEIYDTRYEPSSHCLAWNRNLNNIIDQLKPQYLVTTITRPSVDGEYVPKGYINAWATLKEISPSTSIIGIRDNPWFDFDPALCNELHNMSTAECSRPISNFYRSETTDYLEEQQVSVIVDFSDEFCPNAMCTTLTDDKLLKYRDRHHLSKAYSLTLYNKLESYFENL